MRTWIDVAYLAKTRNMRGGFVARAATGLPFLLEVGDEVAFVPPQLDVPRSAVVEVVKPIDDHTAEVQFAGVDGQAANVLVGSHCLMRRDALDEEALEGAYALWEGWIVIDDKNGEIGTIVGLVENPGQVLLEVEREDGATILVPVVDEIVHTVDEFEQIVRVNLPKGLLDL